MLCCGKDKNAIPPKTSSNVPPPVNSKVSINTENLSATSNSAMKVRAVKLYGVDDKIKTEAIPKTFKPVKQNTNIKYQFSTKELAYAEQINDGHKSHLIGNTDELKFELQEPFGVANTFDIPTFDYETLLSHNLLSRLNSKTKYQYDDGNEPKTKKQ